MPPVRLQSADALHDIIEPVSPSLISSRLALSHRLCSASMLIAANELHTTRGTVQVFLQNISLVKPEEGSINMHAEQRSTRHKR